MRGRGTIFYKEEEKSILRDGKEKEEHYFESMRGGWGKEKEAKFWENEQKNRDIEKDSERKWDRILRVRWGNGTEFEKKKKSRI